MGRRRKKKNPKRSKILHEFRPRRRKLATREGQRVAVLRPENPETVLRLQKYVEGKLEAGVFTEDEARAESMKIMHEHAHRYVGCLSKCQRFLCDENGVKHAGRRPQPGDSFVPFDALVEAHQHEQKLKRQARAKAREAARQSEARATVAAAAAPEAQP